MKLLEITDLSAEYYRHKASLRALRGVSLSVEEGETLSIVGESGCGKSTLALHIMGLVFPGQGRVTAGKMIYRGRDLHGYKKNEWRALRGKEISMVFQDPFSSLNPVLTVREQLEETVAAHEPGIGAETLRARARKALEETVFSDPARILASYPHQLSGGQRQRVMLAAAIINRPKLLIADEPTTSLDVTIQKEIMDLLEKLKRDLSLTMILITHNMPLARQRSDRIAVMYAGQIAEINTAGSIFSEPLHPYTKALLDSVPKMLSDSMPKPLDGQPPDLSALGQGCAFAPRCRSAFEKCFSGDPAPRVSGSAAVRCFLCGRDSAVKDKP